MSRAGGQVKAEKQAEVMARIAEATPPPPVEVPEAAQRALRGQQLFIRCKAVVVERYPSLWPGESIGAAIAESWMQEMQRRLYAQAMQQAEARQIVMPD